MNHCIIISILALLVVEECNALSMTMKSDRDTRSVFSQATASRRTFLNGIGVVTAAPLFVPQQAWSATPPQTGARAPDFDLPNSQGKGTTSLQTLTDAGKWTVLYFYPGAFTSGCTLEARGFQKDSAKYQTLNSQVVGVSVDSVEKNAQFCSEEKLDFFMLSDVGGSVSKSYGTALRIPGFGTFSNRQTYLIDPKGNLRWVFTDVESHIARHSTEVIEKLNELSTLKTA